MDIALTVNLLIKPMAIAFLVAFLATPVVVYVYKHLGWLEDPRKVKANKATHTYPVPRGGGIPIFLAIVTASLLILPIDKHLVGILIGVSLLMVTGVLDDRLDLNPYLRLGLNLMAALTVTGAGIGIAYVTNPFGGIIRLDQLQLPIRFLGQTHDLWIVADILAVVWIVVFMNMVNWSKGFEGQLPGIVVVGAITIALFSLRYSADVTQWPVAILAAITAGAYLGFLPFNFSPQKIMPGYGGGTIAGFMIAVLTILSTSKILTAMVVLGVPVVDATYQVIRRIASGKSPVWGDRGHLHHKILDQWHWGKRKAAIFYWLITAVLGIFALSLNSRQKFYTMIMLIVVIGGLLLWFNFFSNWHDQFGRDKHSKI